MTSPREQGGDSTAGPSPLLPGVAAGDRAAVRECISRYGGLVWSLARRLGNDIRDAEDAAQDVFIALWANAARFDPSVAPETTFVAMIARRTLIDRRRRQARQPSAAVLPDGLAATTPGPLERLELLDDSNRAARALQRLNDDQRRVLTLSIYQGMTYDQIARSTGLPLGTVKTHARRGLIKLRQELGLTDVASGRAGGAP